MNPQEMRTSLQRDGVKPAGAALGAFATCWYGSRAENCTAVGVSLVCHPCSRAAAVGANSCEETSSLVAIAKVIDITQLDARVPKETDGRI